MRFETKGNHLYLYFTHNSGRNFVIGEEVVNGDVNAAKVKLLKKKDEMNGIGDSTQQATS